jgi:thioredoxin 1
VQIAVEYGIRSIPTLILFKNGVKLETMIGAVPKATLEAKLSQNL